MVPPSLRHRLAAVALLALAFVTCAMPATVAAHTDFDYSLPTDGAAVGEPVAEVTVAFSDPVALVGPGFEVLDPQGNLLQPFAVTDDDRVFRLQLDPPLGGGDVGVRWEVTAEDGHVLSGAFSFTVTVDAPTVATPPTSVAPTTMPAVEATTTVPVADATTTTPAGTVAVAAPPTDAAATAPPGSDTSVDSGAPDSTSVGDPSSGNADDDDDDGDSTGWYVAIAVLVAAGAGAFLLVRSRRA